jgi:hypothetical protein
MPLWANEFLWGREWEKGKKGEREREQKINMEWTFGNFHESFPFTVFYFFFLILFLFLDQGL